MGNEEVEFCANQFCRLALPRDREVIRRYQEITFCQTCFDVLETLAYRSWWIKAQLEADEQKKRLGRLKPGEDYLQH